MGNYILFENVSNEFRVLIYDDTNFPYQGPTWSERDKMYMTIAPFEWCSQWILNHADEFDYWETTMNRENAHRAAIQAWWQERCQAQNI